jgi:hypothetical protein
VKITHVSWLPGEIEEIVVVSGNSIAAKYGKGQGLEGG